MLRIAMRTCLLVAAGYVIGSTNEAAHADNGLKLSHGELCVVVGDQAKPAEQRAAELFAANVGQRTGLQIPIGREGSAKYVLTIGTVASNAAIRENAQLRAVANELKEDGFHLATSPDDTGRLYVVGQNPSGVIAGIGKLLRLCRYANDALEIPALTLSSSPEMSLRGTYFCTHYYNFYDVAPLEEVDPIIEESALWGSNYLHVWFDLHHFQNFADPAAQKQLARLKHFKETARRVGMKFSLMMLANEAYASSPKHLRATWKPGWSHYHVELCPSKPEALALMGKWHAEVLDAFGDLDLVVAWPYDQGGCACEQCAPWGSNGLLRAAEQLARLFHERNPNGKFVLSTWLFDSLDEKGRIGWEGLINDVEYPGLFRYMREKKPDWLQMILMGTHGDWIPEPLLKRPSPEKYPLINFPEISMYGMIPWGGYGANPLPEWSTHLARKLRDHIVGGYPYSEGLYEDINKFLWTQFYWSPDRPTKDILAEYATYYLEPNSADNAVRLFYLLEKTHKRKKGWEVDNLAEADDAWALTQSIDQRLPERARSSWRWRIIYLRSAIDHVLKNQGYRSPGARAALTPLCDELVRLYHAEHAFIRPPLPGNLAFRKPIEASSTNPENENSVGTLVNGVYAEHHPADYWAHDPAKEKTAWLLIDTGTVIPMKEVRLQFRQVDKTFRSVPQSVGFDVSTDGKTFESAGESTSVPTEGAEYMTRFWSYKIDKTGRYFRVRLGPSQCTQGEDAGAIALTEVQAFGE